MAQYFDAAYYLNAKLAQTQRMHETDANGNPYTLTSLSATLQAAGFSPEAHYAAFGRAEGLQPNAYFNESEYLSAKLLQLQNNADPAVAAQWQGKSAADVQRAFAEAGLNPAQHYELYGAFETDAQGRLINPSNAFDANAYVAAKQAQMIANGDVIYGKPASQLTPAEVLGVLGSAGFSPVSHYLAYGAWEANTQKVALVQTVPTSQRVPNDLGRQPWEYVPANDSAPTAGPGQNTAQAVPRPSDVGGKADASISPPVTPPQKPIPVPGDPGYTGPAPVAPLLKAVPSENGGAYGAVLSGSTGENTHDIARISVDGMQLSATGQSGSVKLSEGGMLDARAVTGQNVLHIDTRASSLEVLTIYGASDTANTVTFVKAATLQGGSKGDTFMAKGKASVANPLNMGQGNDSLIIEDSLVTTVNFDGQGGSITLGGGTLIGTFRGSINGSAGADSLLVQQDTTVQGALALGQGGDSLSIAAGRTFNASVTLDAGGSLSLSGGGTLSGSISGSAQADSLVVHESMAVGFITLGQGGDSLTLATGKTLATLLQFNDAGGSITLHGNGALSGLVYDSGKADKLIVKDNATAGDIYFGSGADTLTLEQSLTATLHFRNFGEGSISLNGGGAFKGDVLGNAVSNTLYIQQNTSVVGNIALGAGNDILSFEQGATLKGSVVLGMGDATAYEGRGTFQSAPEQILNAPAGTKLHIGDYMGAGSSDAPAMDGIWAVGSIDAMNGFKSIGDNQVACLQGFLLADGKTFALTGGAGDTAAMLLVYDGNSAVGAGNINAQCVVITGTSGFSFNGADVVIG